MTKFSAALLASVVLVDTAYSGNVNSGMDSVTVSRIADAIFRAEGTHSKHPYGVTIPCTSPRMVCVNTVTHAWRDFERQTNSKSQLAGVHTEVSKCNLGPVSLPFIQFLGARYCPPSIDAIGHRNWTNNVFRIIQQKERKNK